MIHLTLTSELCLLSKYRYDEKISLGCVCALLSVGRTEGGRDFVTKTQQPLSRFLNLVSYILNSFGLVNLNCHNVGVVTLEFPSQEARFHTGNSAIFILLWSADLSHPDLHYDKLSPRSLPSLNNSRPPSLSYSIPPFVRTSELTA